MVFHREMEAALWVCPQCDHHLRIGTKERLSILFGERGYARIPVPAVPTDPIRFRDSMRYTERLRQAWQRSNGEDALVVVEGDLDGHRIVAAVQDFGFLGGSMGLAVGEGFVTAAKRAVQGRMPLIAFSASGGARMQEGMLSLMQMPRTVVAVQRLREAGLPFIVVLTDPTTGGVTASFAMLGDIALAEPEALIGFAGPRVIQQTIRQTLPEGFQRAEYLLEHGMLDMVVHRRDLRATLSRIVDLLLNTAPRVEKADQIAGPQHP
jgi:acetyl-CoA carboxylase carboxyl transferase subunit beta